MAKERKGKGLLTKERKGKGLPGYLFTMRLKETKRFSPYPEKSLSFKG